MSQSFTHSLNRPPASNGVTTAIRMADIYIKQNSNAEGKVTDPAVIQYAINNFLAPLSANPQVQLKMATLANTVKSLTTASNEANYSKTDFEQKIRSDLFAKDENSRSPMDLVSQASQHLDARLIQLDQAIETLKGANKDTDSLVGLRADLQQLADDERALYNNLISGTTNPSLDGYGYFVKTNPVDGSLMGAAVLPVSRVKRWVQDLDPGSDTGMKRVNSTFSLGNTKLPVYLNATKGADGSYTAKLGGNEWSSDGADSTSALDQRKGSMTKGEFNITDATSYPVSQFSLQPGQFAQGVAGLNADGSPATSYYYKGHDNKIYSLSENAYAQFAQDPNMKSNLSRAVYLDQQDVKAFGRVVPMDDMTATQERNASIPPLPGTTISAYKPSFFEKVGGAVENAAGAVGNFVGGAVDAIGGFFNRKQPTPQSPSASANGSSSAPDVVASGAKFFAGKA